MGKHIYTTAAFAVFSALTFASCLPAETAPPSPTATAAAPDLTFGGATSASDLNGTTIQVNWSAGTGQAITGYKVYEVNSDSSLSTVGNVSSTSTSYVIAGLTAGTFHSYIVRAVDSAGDTDGNGVTVSALAYAGITGVSSATTTGLVVTVSRSNAASAVHIYCAPSRSGVYSLVGSVGGEAGLATLTGLYSGTTYTCYALGVGPTGVEDSNTATVTGQTTSFSSTLYQGVLAVSAYGAAPVAPTGTPTSAQVTVTWKGFTSARSTTQYALVRTSVGNTLDMTTTTACTAASVTSCLVCTVTGSGAQGCTDTNVGPSPSTYDYAVTEMPGGWVEETPVAGDSVYRITVEIPPENMVLVHRDAANAEICALMNKQSDPFNHQRCAYTGLGATPYNSNPLGSPLNLTTGYYDFGYDLFVDRWTAACNWTASACVGAGSGNNDCWGSSVPGMTATAGTVYYSVNNASCWVNLTGTSSGWQQTAANTLSSDGVAIISPTYFAKMYTVQPSTTKRKPPITAVDQISAYAVCNSVSDPDYGAKRLLRRREYIAAAAPPWMPGEPGARSDSATLTLQSYSANASPAYGCNAYGHSTTEQNGTYNGVGYNTTQNTFTTGASFASTFNSNDLSGGTGGGQGIFVLGSIETSKCVSRFGLQDYVGNVEQWVSDQLASCNETAQTCIGGVSNLDGGNIDFNGFEFDGVQAPGAMTGGQVAGTYGYTNSWQISNVLTMLDTSNGGFGAANFSVPFGMALVGTDSGNALSIINGAFPATKLHAAMTIVNTNSGAFTRSMAVGGAWNFQFPNNDRFTSDFGQADTGEGNWGPYNGFRCAVPAQ